MKTLKVGFVGNGFIAQFQLKAMAQFRSMELSGVLNRSGAETLCAMAQSLGVGEPKIYGSISEMAQHVDAIALYSPNDTRIEAMQEIVAARKKGGRVFGVICDKPLGRNVREARQMVQLAEEGKLLTAYFENQIHMKAISAQLAQLAPQQRTMGPLSLTRSAEEHAGPHMPWFWDPTRQGGGVLSDMGCHSIAVGWYALNPIGKPITFLEPQSVTCEVGLLKWGQPQWRDKLLRERGVDYRKTPAEDFATGVITYRNPETGQKVKAQFTDSWMFDKQGLRLFMDGMGPGYAFEINTLVSPLNLFIADAAASQVADQETALEKSTASRGLLTVQPNEADLYGYVDENLDAAQRFLRGDHGLLPFSYGLEITRLVMASYLSAEKKQTVDLTCTKTRAELESYIPLIQQGKGADQLY